jgi:2-isopropylmalate synthase
MFKVRVEGKHSRLSKLAKTDDVNSHESKGTGDGPVNALDSALRHALIKFYPQLEEIRLTDYKVRIIDGISGTAARTRVLIQSADGRREWGTVGVSENIIEASLQALVDSMEYALLKK